MDDTVNPNPDLPTMRDTTMQQQFERQRVSHNWKAYGYKRYVQSNALLDAMSVFGGEDDNGGASAERFRPLQGPLEEDFPIKK